MGTGTALFSLDDLYARELTGLHEPWAAAVSPTPALVQLNTALAAELGLDVGALASPDGVQVLVGNATVEGSTPVAMAYAGHQFGNYSPRLGDGRALLLGELVDPAGRRLDLHLKGSGRTTFARGGDGKAALGPMLREYVISEAMHALGIPTTRSLAVLTTGETIMRDTPLPGALLVRVASSHLRVGSFQYAAATGDLDLLQRLADHAIRRHHPDLADRPDRHLALFERVAMRQADLVAQWILAGFIHGVMNTDNTTISGETIDYGPCAFMDRHAANTVFSSIDQGGRYRYSNQPPVLQWNLARLAEALLPLIDADQQRAVELATDVLQRFADRYLSAWHWGMCAKLGIDPADESAADVASAVPAMLEAGLVDHNQFFRSLSSVLRGDAEPTRSLFAGPLPFVEWSAGWAALLPTDPVERSALADELDRVNPIYVPRNHLVEAALTAATAGDLAPFERLLEAVRSPFDARPGFESFAEPAPTDGAPYRTFCGT